MSALDPITRVVWLPTPSTALVAPAAACPTGNAPRRPARVRGGAARLCLLVGAAAAGAGLSVATVAAVAQLRPAGDPLAALAGPLRLAEAEQAATVHEAARVAAQAGVGDVGQGLADQSSALSAIEARGRAIRQRQASLGAEAEAVQSSLAATPPRIVDNRETSSADAGQDGRALLLRLRLDRAHMAQLYAPEYPGLAELDRKLKLVEQALATMPRSTGTIERDMRNPTYTRLADRIVALQVETRALSAEAVELVRQKAEIGSRLALLSDVAQTLAGLQRRAAAQDGVVNQLTTAATQIQIEAATAPRGRPPSWPEAASAGGLLGLIGGLLWRRRSGTPPSERPRRDLAGAASRPLPRTSARKPRFVAPTPVELRRAAASIIEATGGSGRLTTIHLSIAGNAGPSEAKLLVHALAGALAARNRRVLVLRLGADGGGDMQSFAASFHPARHVAVVHAAPLAPAAASVALALCGDVGAADDFWASQIAQLRRGHDMVLLQTEPDMPADLGQELTRRVDLDLGSLDRVLARGAPRIQRQLRLGEATACA